MMAISWRDVGTFATASSSSPPGRRGYVQEVMKEDEERFSSRHWGSWKILEDHPRKNMEKT
jgi:hypothetical protein